jgi:hypothetical protein
VGREEAKTRCEAAFVRRPQKRPEQQGLANSPILPWLLRIKLADVHMPDARRARSKLRACRTGKRALAHLRVRAHLVAAAATDGNLVDSLACRMKIDPAEIDMALKSNNPLPLCRPLVETSGW